MPGPTPSSRFSPTYRSTTPFRRSIAPGDHVPIFPSTPSPPKSSPTRHGRNTKGSTTVAERFDYDYRARQASSPSAQARGGGGAGPRHVQQRPGPGAKAARSLRGGAGSGPGSSPALRLSSSRGGFSTGPRVSSPGVATRRWRFASSAAPGPAPPRPARAARCRPRSVLRSLAETRSPRRRRGWSPGGRRCVAEAGAHAQVRRLDAEPGVREDRAARLRRPGPRRRPSRRTRRSRR